MKSKLFLFFYLISLTIACSERESPDFEEDKDRLTELIHSFENQGNKLVDEIILISRFYGSLLDNKDQTLVNWKKDKYQFNGPYPINSSDRDSLLSSVVLMTTSPDSVKARDEVRYTNELDSLFRLVYNKYDIIAQVYSNSELQVSRVFPTYDVNNIIDPNLDLTEFNFYYEADEEHNPTKGAVWIPDPYIDPAGKGWILSLVHPVYNQNNLSAVVGIDIRIDHFVQEFLEKLQGDFLVVTGKGDIVGANATAIEALSMPPLKNHVYRETIQADNFRISDFNLFNSKSREVREMAKNFLLESRDQFEFEEEAYLSNAICMKFGLIDWYAIKINFDN